MQTIGTPGEMTTQLDTMVERWEQHTHLLLAGLPCALGRVVTNQRVLAHRLKNRNYHEADIDEISEELVEAASNERTEADSRPCTSTTTF